MPMWHDVTMGCLWKADLILTQRGMRNQLMKCWFCPRSFLWKIKPGRKEWESNNHKLQPDSFSSSSGFTWSPMIVLFGFALLGHHSYSISIAAQALITLLWQTWRRMQAKAPGLHNAFLDGFGWPWIPVSKCEMLLAGKITQLLDVNGSQILRCFRLFLDQHVIHWLAGWKKVQPAPSFFCGGGWVKCKRADSMLWPEQPVTRSSQALSCWKSIGQPIGENIPCQEFVVPFFPVVVCAQSKRGSNTWTWRNDESQKLDHNFKVLWPCTLCTLSSDSCIINHCQSLWDNLMQVLSALQEKDIQNRG